MKPASSASKEENRRRKKRSVSAQPVTSGDSDANVLSEKSRAGAG